MNKKIIDCMQYLRIFVSIWLRSGWVWGKMVKGLGLRCLIHDGFQYLNPNPKTIWQYRMSVSKCDSVSFIVSRHRVSTNVSPFDTAQRITVIFINRLR